MFRENGQSTADDSTAEWQKPAQKSSSNKLINELTLLWIIKTDTSFSLPINVDLKTSVFHQFNLFN